MEVFEDAKFAWALQNHVVGGLQVLLGEPKNRNAQSFLCSQNVKPLSANCFKASLNAEIQLVNHSI